MVTATSVDRIQGCKWSGITSSGAACVTPTSISQVWQATVDAFVSPGNNTATTTTTTATTTTTTATITTTCNTHTVVISIWSIKAMMKQR